MLVSKHPNHESAMNLVYYWVSQIHIQRRGYFKELKESTKSRFGALAYQTRYSKNNEDSYYVFNVAQSLKDIYSVMLKRKDTKNE